MKNKRPIIGHFLYKYFGIETTNYKYWWKKHCIQMQNALNMQHYNQKIVS